MISATFEIRRLSFCKTLYADCEILDAMLVDKSNDKMNGGWAADSKMMRCDRITDR